MAGIETFDFFNDTEAGMKWATEMKPYTFHVARGFGLEGREISVILPADTKYSLGMILQKSHHGFTHSGHHFVDSSVISVPAVTGKVYITLNSKAAHRVIGDEVVTFRSTQVALVSLSLLPRNASKAMYFERLKKKDVQVLAESDNSLLTKDKTSETFEKTLIKDDLICQIQVTNEGRSSDVLLYQLLSKIRLTPQFSLMGLLKKIPSISDKRA
jgi:hypothetical protein